MMSLTPSKDAAVLCRSTRARLPERDTVLVRAVVRARLVGRVVPARLAETPVPPGLSAMTAAR